MRRIMVFILLAAGVLLAGCRGDEPNNSTLLAPSAVGQGQTKVTLDGDDFELPTLPPPGEFVAEITNPWLPLTPGKVFHYENETKDGLETIDTEVTAATKTILGVVTTVIRDREYLDGELVEDTEDWFAQDQDGNVWYFGEFSTTYENGLPTGNAGSWEAGVDGAEPGIIMLARPREGAIYPQERAPGVAEDMAKVLGWDRNVKVEYGRFRDVLVTEEWSPLDPGAVSYKFYARGVGLILDAERRNGSGERVELVSIDGIPGAEDDKTSEAGPE